MSLKTFGYLRTKLDKTIILVVVTLVLPLTLLAPELPGLGMLGEVAERKQRSSEMLADEKERHATSRIPISKHER